jgi:hypothetical protein
MEPITLFSRNADPAGVARTLRELAPSVQIDGPDANWRTAVVSIGAGEDKRTLIFTHDPAYYSEPQWSTQMNGMSGFFTRFPDSARKPLAIAITTTLRFALGTLTDPDFDSDEDPRLEILFAVAKFLDGVLFTPSSLRDAQGRILFGFGGRDDDDPDAVWPRVVAQVTVPDPREVAGDERATDAATSSEEEVPPPTAERVARRALALTAVTVRAILEQDTADPEAEDTFQALLAWVDDIGIDSEFEPSERELVQTELSGLHPKAQLNATWRLEGLVVLAWALGRFQLPPPDQLVSLRPLWESLGYFDPEVAKALLTMPTLRPREEMRTLRQRLFAIHWRLRNYFANPGVMNFTEFARTCWFGPLDISGLPLVKGDLALGGKRIDRASADAFDAAHSASQERHQAANWLWEGPERYSDASVAT